MKNEAIVIGGGLAGSEAAWQLANRGIHVKLYEMRPSKKTPAHHTGNLAELVCSNSLRSDRLENAVGLLKEEMRKLGSLIMESADKNRVPAGGALAVDRHAFSQYITGKISAHPNITLINQEIDEIPEGYPVIIATGPLSSSSISKAIKNMIDVEYLYFYDAAAPIVSYDSLDHTKVFKASRYGRGDDYINCPMTQEEYELFWNELINAEGVILKEFERSSVFEGCMPIEVMARRGMDTLRFGPLKPVGLLDPRTGKQPYAVVQLRQDDTNASIYNIVGFQTNLKFGEQKRVFSLIPGLEGAVFIRYGVMHRNTFINSPKTLNCFYQMRSNPFVYFAGQITGVEGYVESASSGLVAGINLARQLLNKSPIDFTNFTAIGALCHYISDERIKNFQPMNVNFGIMEPLEYRVKNKQDKNRKISERSLKIIEDMIDCND
ncbi:methylenetetrahydrofolate--tRNA-(uracil(54)-C(5))-methyltransferase (FADH(2)-oxidizing) TrmFO [Xylanivirga thermophila]|uniref:methylenetetrahydrofolate--tRNA-(uracil(54)- C(5))-methyltransferase (FADH(2)-oxidizing) TrmFO n=1 Tax=Xylanivirga thermophila TaxID=2496273 RepID=UPI00101D1867|nr:methylenetetrahydrofolate--tRNA-(uracil(54)-C(5))-methyltransferase (FADH(2)-oxidizing) TrmFO [Xylanivirga thermophila]